MTSTTHWTFTDHRSPLAEPASNSRTTGLATDGHWHTIATHEGEFRIRRAILRGGLGDGVEILEVATGAFRACILPTRGMSLWKLWLHDWEIGWQSPVSGPVHPSLVRLEEPSGLGWLDGFDELVSRCGLESNGAPDFDEHGRLTYPLHGKIGNIPACHLSVSVDHETGILSVTGVVPETRFLIQSLVLKVTYRFRVHQPRIACEDCVTNQSSKPSSMQLLYHINVGSPILQAGSKVAIDIDALAPRDGRAADGIDTWDTFLGPTAGYAEQVYFAKPRPDLQGWSRAVLHDSQKSRGVAVGFDTSTLPYFSLWKNTAATEDGYVAGLEPATGFPNPRTFEANQNRVVSLAGGESRLFRWELEVLDGSSKVESELQQLRARMQAATIHRTPLPSWSKL